MGASPVESLIYLCALLVFLALYVLSKRPVLRGKLLSYGTAWAGIFFTIMIGSLLWNELRSDIPPRQTALIDTAGIAVPRASDGHYYLTLEVNGTPTRFVVDTGATGIVLSEEAAEAAGVDLGILQYNRTAQTANGIVSTAPIRLETLALEGILDRNVLAVVNGGEMPESLLGMSYLSRFDRMEIRDGQLILER